LCVLAYTVAAVTVLGDSSHAQSIEASLQALRAWTEAGRYVEAEAEAQRLFEQDASTSGLLVDALLRNGRGAESRTRQLAEQTVASDAASAVGDVSMARNLRQLGDVLLEAGDYQRATARLRESLELLERRQGAELETGEALRSLARALVETGRYDEALPLCDRSVSIFETLGPTTRIDLGQALQVRAYLRQQKGEYPLARADIERAHSLIEPGHGVHPETARVLTLLGWQLSLEGSLVEARTVLTGAVTMTESVLRPGHPDIAASLRSLALPVRDLGDLSAARTFLERARPIAEQSFGVDHLKVAIQLNDLAGVLLLQGDYAAARGLYERAMKIYEERLGPDFVGVTVAVFNLAILNSELDDQKEARALYQRAIASWKRTLGDEHPTVALALTGFATFLARRGLDKEALTLYQQALAINERALGAEHPTVAQTLSRSAVVLARLGQRRRARELSERALVIWEKSGAQDRLADGLVAHATILEGGGDLAGAAKVYERALELRLPLLGPSHPGIAEVEVPLAVVEARLLDRQAAFDRALHGEEISRNHSRLTLGYLSERQALEYASSRPRGLDLALSLANESQGNRAFDALIKGRSLTLDEIGARRRLIVNQMSGALAPLWTTLVSARQRFANLVVRGPGSQTPAQYTALVDEARREKEQAERALAEQSATFRSEQQRAEVGFEQVRAALPSNSALVSFVRFNRTTPPTSGLVPSDLAFVLKAGAADPEIVSLGRADQIEPLIARWRSEMMAAITRRAGSASETERAFRVTGASLRNRLWDPIAPHLTAVSRVFIVPDDAINLVTFAALPSGTARYLLEDGQAIHYLTTERDLVRTEPAGSDAGRGLLAVGGAAYADGSLFASLSNGNAQPTQEPVTTMASASFRGGGATCGSFQSMQFDALPASGQEAQDVAGLWRGTPSSGSGDVSALLGREASERAVKQQAPGRRILHLATHGFFLGDECSTPLEGTRAVGGLVATNGAKPTRERSPRVQTFPENPLLLSGLALAGANRRAAASPQEDDGILTAEEVASLNLEGVEWAVLSACDTGLGQLRAGEGVFGLRRAFQVAGARTVVMSLWQVEDRSARAWMQALYAGRLVRQLDTIDAVREASLTVLRDRRARQQSTHPFYWAGFVAAGDWH
jgi:CHAT domain-containing protein/tetratricopeptide (TPR) repeat protein